MLCSGETAGRVHTKQVPPLSPPPLRRRRRQADFLQKAIGNLKCLRHSKTITASAEANKPSSGLRPRGRGIWFSRRIATLNNDTLQREPRLSSFVSRPDRGSQCCQGETSSKIYTNPFKCRRQNLSCTTGQRPSNCSPFSSSHIVQASSGNSSCLSQIVPRRNPKRRVASQWSFRAPAARPSSKSISSGT